MVRKLTVLTALALMLLPALVAQSENPAAIRSMNTQEGTPEEKRVRAGYRESQQLRRVGAGEEPPL